MPMVNVSERFGLIIPQTIQLWIKQGLINPNSYGMAVSRLVEGQWLENVHFGIEHKDQKRSPAWHLQNADGMALICEVLCLDSLDACQRMPWRVDLITGAYPCGGAVINEACDLIVSTSGGTDEQNEMVSRWLISAITACDETNLIVWRESATEKIKLAIAYGAIQTADEDAPEARKRFINS